MTNRFEMLWQKALSEFRGDLCGSRGWSESSDLPGKLKVTKQVSQNTCVRTSRSFAVSLPTVISVSRALGKGILCPNTDSGIAMGTVESADAVCAGINQSSKCHC